MRWSWLRDGRSMSNQSLVVGRRSLVDSKTLKELNRCNNVCFLTYGD